MFTHVRNAMFFAFAGLAVVLAFVSIAIAAAIVGPTSYATLANLMLVGAVVAVCITVIGTVVFFVNDVRRSRRRREARTTLATFMQSGAALVSACHTMANTNGAVPDVGAWSAQVFNYLRDAPDLVDLIRFDGQIA